MTTPNLPPRSSAAPRFVVGLTLPLPAPSSPSPEAVEALAALAAEEVAFLDCAPASTPTVVQVAVPVPVSVQVAASIVRLSPTGGVNPVREGLGAAPTRRNIDRRRMPRYVRYNDLRGCWEACRKADVGASTFGEACAQVAAGIKARLDAGGVAITTRALTVLFNRQLAFEQNTAWTTVDNDRGWNKPDSRRFTARAKALLEGLVLSEMEAREIGPALAKYSGQLARKAVIGESS